MFPAALRSVVAGGQITKATLLVQEMTDIILSEPFDAIQTRYHNLNTGTLSVSCPLDEVAAPPPYDDYTAKKWACDLRLTGTQDPGPGLPDGFGRVHVECVDASGATVTCPAGLRRVTVSVFWGDGGSRSVSLVSNVARIR
jgi:hypothetical protein